MEAANDNDAHAGKHVIFTDEHSVQHDALVTRCWGPELGFNAVNLLYVVSDASKFDQYGRQIERASSVAAKSQSGATAHGRFYEVVE